MSPKLFGVICVAALVAACSPAATLAPSGTAVPTTIVLPSSSAGAALPAEPEAVKTVARPWRSGEFQQGIQLYWHTKGTDEALQAAADRTLDYVVNLGANSVGISFPIYTDGQSPTKVYRGTETPTDRSLAIVITAALRRGLRVTLRPIIDEANIAIGGHGYWRGTIRPGNPAGWFVSYDAVVVAIARVAAHYRIQEFVAGTELPSLQAYRSSWQNLSKLIRRTGFTGVISYALNWDNISSVPFSSMGLDAYPRIFLPDSASVTHLASALKSSFMKIPSSIRRILTIQEAGIPAQNGMYPHPFEWGNTVAATNLAVQTNWFTAMCQAARQTSLHGLYYWMLDSNVDPAHLDPATQPGAGFIGRPAERAIRSCFKTA